MSSSTKVALITGSTSGIGLAIAHALAEKGVDVIITGFGDEATITGIVNEIKTRYGVTVHYLAADLSQVSDIDSLWSGVLNAYPDGIDILINNAGTGQPGPIESVSDDHWNKLFAVNLTEPFQLIKRCLPAMKQKVIGILEKFVADKTEASTEEARNAFQSSIPTGKYNTPEQVAELVEFLCLSNASAQMTGAAYLIDHGLTAQ